MQVQYLQCIAAIIDGDAAYCVLGAKAEVVDYEYPVFGKLVVTWIIMLMC